MKKKLIILVGESGAGKSTLCKLIDSPENCYSSSGAIVSGLNEKGIQVNHDTIHAFANKAYGDDPEWQVPLILDFLNKAGVAILDGPRRLQEVRALKRQVKNCKIIRVVADQEIRGERLHSRDGADLKAFQRVVKDEDKETELGQLLEMADYIIENNEDLSILEKEAVKIQSEIKEFSNTEINNIN
jgi:dephospho-CoA kinase